MSKEVSNRIIVILIIIAVVVSVFGTYFVYTNTSNIKTTGNMIINNEEPKSTSGQVGVTVVNPEEQEGEDDG